MAGAKNGPASALKPLSIDRAKLIRKIETGEELEENELEFVRRGNGVCGATATPALTLCSSPFKPHTLTRTPQPQPQPQPEP